MKKRSTKLSLSRETLRALGTEALAVVAGGLTANTCHRSCRVSLCRCMSLDACTERCPI